MIWSGTFAQAAEVISQSLDYRGVLPQQWFRDFLKSISLALEGWAELRVEMKQTSRNRIIDVEDENGTVATKTPERLSSHRRDSW